MKMRRHYREVHAVKQKRLHAAPDRGQLWSLRDLRV